MRLLVDTNAYIWFAGAPQKLSPAAMDAMTSPDTTAYVSAASVWEITTKFRLGKLPQAALIAADVPAAIATDGFEALAIGMTHAQLAGALPGEHRDPFDRMLAAQAQIEGLQIVSTDAAFDSWGVKRIW